MSLVADLLSENCKATHGVLGVCNFCKALIPARGFLSLALPTDLTNLISARIALVDTFLVGALHHAFALCVLRLNTGLSFGLMTLRPLSNVLLDWILRNPLFDTGALDFLALDPVLGSRALLAAVRLCDGDADLSALEALFRLHA